jgi:hypothetical protein
MLKPQCFGDMHKHDQTCAIGAAMDADGVLDAWENADRAVYVFDEWMEKYPIRREFARCPQCHLRGFVTDVIIHLNDEHHMTREQIADWLEHIEAQHEAGQAAKAEPVLVTA